MPKYFDEEGNEIEEIPELKQLEEERNALVKEKEELLAEKARLEEGSADKNKNFENLRKLLEENKQKLEEATRRLQEKDEWERNTTKENLFRYYAGDDAESRTRLEEEYGFINIEESNPENIAKRVEKAARMSGLYKEETKENPIFSGGWNGSAPFIKPTKSTTDESDNILNTEKGRSALNAMGIPLE